MDNISEMNDKQAEHAVATKPLDMPFDASLFKTDNRIHSEESSVFTYDHFLMVHKRELAPENEPRLVSKVLKHFSTPRPSFFTMQPQANIALLSSAFIPVSAESRKERLLKELQDLYLEDKIGNHPDYAEIIERYGKPYGAHMKAWTELPETDPVASEYYQHSLSVYLLLEEAVKEKKLSYPLAHYIKNFASLDAMVSDLSNALGFTPQEFVDASSNRGVEGIADLLGIDSDLVSEIKELSALAAEDHFPDNMIESWKASRHIEELKDRPMEEKIQAGTILRTAEMVQLLRLQHGRTPWEASEDVNDLEDRIVSRLRKLPQEVQEALYYSGTEIACTADGNISRIFGAPMGALGLHLHSSLEHGTNSGVRQVYISSMNSPVARDRYLFHEVHHMVFPKHFSEDDINHMDELVAQGASRLAELNQYLKAWEIGDETEKRAIEAEINDLFQTNGISLQEALGGEITEGAMEKLLGYVHFAHKNFDPHSPDLARGYPTPELRAAELISRYSEMRFSALANHPDMLTFIAPEMKTVYEDYYLPHIRAELQELKDAQHQYPDHMKHLGFPKTPLLQQKPMEELQPGTKAMLAGKPANQIDANHLELEASINLPYEVQRDLEHLAHDGTFVSRLDQEAQLPEELSR